MDNIRRDLRGKTEAADRHLTACDLCAHKCGVDRRRGELGVCRADATPRIFRHSVDWAGEAGLVPTLVVNPSGCNFMCDFCITGAQSQRPEAGNALHLAHVSRWIDAAPVGLRSLMIEGGEPTIHLPTALRIAERVPRELLLVWKTNGYASEEALGLLDGVPDVLLTDYKFGNDRCAQRLAGVPDYSAVARANLEWGAGQRKLIVRHLVMPGHLECCTLPVLDWLASGIPGVPLSLMNGYVPVFRASSHPELGRTLRATEVERAREEAQQRNLTLIPWEIVKGTASVAADDHVWIDRNGRLYVNSTSSALAECLRRLEPEFMLEN